MLYMNITLFIISLGLLAISYKDAKNCLRNIDKKEHKLFFLYPLSRLILSKFGLEKYLRRKEKVSGAITALNISDKPEAFITLYWYRKLSIVFLIIFLFNLLSILGQVQSKEDQSVLNNQSLIRPSYGEGNMVKNLTVSVDASATNFTEDIQVLVKEQEYSEEELQRVMGEAIPYLEKEVLGENVTYEQIEKDLNFISEIPGTGIQVKWYPEDDQIITGNGRIVNEDINPKGIRTTVKAALVYKETEMEHVLAFHILPKELTEKEQLMKDLNREIQEQSDQTRKDRIWKLPERLGCYLLKWEEKKENVGSKLFFLGILAAVLIWVYSDKELENKMKKRKNQMLIDYPEIINKFNLLIHAGMTIKQAWCKITEDYIGKPDAGGKNKRFAYEEMLITVHELKLGVPEANAYEQFGRRTGVMPYLKFSSLIAQNLKKGNRGLSELLGREAMDAFEERKELAKRLGEEAGTKLLGPMMLMLVIVLIIILIPAMMSFRI